MTKEQLQGELMPLIDGLLMRSETDSPFEFYYFDNTQNLPLDAETAAKLTGKTNSTEIKTEPLDYFFRNMVRLYPEDGEDRKQEAQRFALLQQKLQELLRDVQVYKADEISITAYILGTTPEGDIAGIRTVVVET
ncbi:sugar-non-specific nuclease inhibitor NuiA-like protein [Pontibacter sp. KCTC 32443]|uniref:nuclease A inhibitor family protein n=1 Tax=Pontibacter TaxID=323449 RepID=UPI00164D6B5E|nr:MULTISPECIES: nuclease A inhibitor family protein [Pontibacter]MBC5773551.1 sugar-non-specific nuclease inhibitor NuiA-like protein [Pontibacter sp. KCTC 32443]